MELSIVKIKYKGKCAYVLFDNDKSTIYQQEGKPKIAFDMSAFDETAFNESQPDCFFDYDCSSLESPVNTMDILNKWNFLSDIAALFGMHFEGNEKKHTRAYSYLFCCSTSVDKKEFHALPPFCIISLKKVFSKKHRQLNRLFSVASQAELPEEEKIDLAAMRILHRYRKAFEELAK